MAIVSLGYTNRSITAGVGATTAAAQNTGRQYLLVQNLHDTAIVYVRCDGVAAAVGVAGNIMLVPHAVYYEETFVPTGAVSIISDTASTPVTVWEG